METRLNKWYDDAAGVYTRDTWAIPEEGALVWCETWDTAKVIKPYGDGAHIYVGSNIFHCDEFVGKMGDRIWGLCGIQKTREQFINGRWVPVAVAEEAHYHYALQECTACGKVFPAKYSEDGNIILGACCTCGADFIPAEGEMSYSQWRQLHA